MERSITSSPKSTRIRRDSKCSNPGRISSAITHL